MDSAQTVDNEHVAQIASLAREGSAALVAYVYSLPLEERLTAARTVQRSLFAAAQDASGLDLYAETMRTLIDRGTYGLKAGTSDDDDKVLDAYNAMSFNFAADLADCWPEDSLPCERRHFEAGLRAAEDCIRWRNELDKPPRPFSIAYWAKGMHLLSLGHTEGAVKSFNLALGFALRDAQASGKLAPVGPQATFDVLLSTGYLGLAEQVEGNPQGQQRYADALAAFRQQAMDAEAGGDAEQKEDAEFGIAQLETVRSRYVR